MIPAFHAAIDEGLPDAHDDPQEISTSPGKFAPALQSLISKLGGLTALRATHSLRCTLYYLSLEAGSPPAQTGSFATQQGNVLQQQVEQISSKWRPSRR